MFESEWNAFHIYAKAKSEVANSRSKGRGGQWEQNGIRNDEEKEKKKGMRHA